MRETKRFRFGVVVRSARSRGDWIAKARKIEDLGYSVLAVPDHLSDVVAAMPALVSAAEATRHLRVATAVLNNDLRHPVLVAREAATVDVLTDGRFELGLGGGHMRAEYEQAGLHFDPGATRVERLAEAVGIVKRLLTGDKVSFSGRHYRVTDHMIYPRSVQRPRPRIFIGGNAERLLRLAAREADIVGLTGITFRRGGAEPDVLDSTAAVVDDRIRLVREVADDRYDELEINALVQRVVVTEDRQKAVEALPSRWAQLSAEEILESPYVLIGTVDALVEDLLARRERWDISYYLTHEPYAEALAPVVARLADT